MWSRIERKANKRYKRERENERRREKGKVAGNYKESKKSFEEHK